MADTDTLVYEKRGRVAHITINRPESMNALNRATQGAIADAWEEMGRDPDILVGIITGAGGRAFSAGMDLKERAGDTEAGNTTPLRTVWGVELWKPVIAAIDGYCVAGGLEISLYCDFRIATEQSQFGLPEPRWSLLAGYGLHNLSRMTTLGNAMYMQLTGNRVSADAALRMGLIQEVLPDRDTLMERADRLADDIQLCAPLAVQAIKRIVMTGKNLPIEYAQRLAADTSKLIQQTEDSVEGPKAFAEKRSPVWKMQ